MDPGSGALTALAVVVGLLFLAGLVGSIVPWMPGPLFVLAGAALWAFATRFETLGWGRLAILTALAALSAVLGVLAAGLGARRYGASRWGVVGAILGAVVGLFLGPLGLILGGVAGAAAGELLRGADLAGSVRSGFGTLIGLLVGLAADLGVSLTMIGLFLVWIWRG
jgi:uncharacterized protein YqgC (DUF456 family)